VTFVNFDANYVERLRSGDSETELHFTKYFGSLLFLKLRHRLRSAQLIEDVQQETLFRVLRIIQNRGIEHPERLGAFVHAVCGNVLLEQIREDGKLRPMPEDAPEPADSSVNLDASIHGEEMREMIEGILEALPPKDHSLLRMLFLQEMPKDEICRLLNVDGDYLRVLLHRAKSRFRTEYLKRAGAAGAARKASV
jgi:RNA polymerase sigma-70 factor, ECF subfamily